MNRAERLMKKAHALTGHANVNGHFCPEWDFLWICSECPEYECCSCFKRDSAEDDLDPYRGDWGD